ncbi:hypothetical protein [Variovorax saccharolyticus]|uniref:hypothetical protein n=1 Tax=Variovorax saccharolyticus TaxID=3053516 RepID=UPI002577EF26|nr:MULTISPECIES: hypothetical protein [unclassified Variovorax]MDM0022658.1 hypothetical protein [Variovorax sp. J22R187]MDM0029557.1 hypothetical protein [Variovorax sp. J31P216]
MLTIDQKEAVLRRAGRTVPEFPSVHDASHSQASDTRVAQRRERRQAIDQWSADVAALYVEHLASGIGKP